MMGYLSKTIPSLQEDQQKRAEGIKEEGRLFLEEDKTREGVIETASGLQYKIIESG